MDQVQQEMLEKIARQSVLDSLFENDVDLGQVPDAALERVYDDIMGETKTAAAAAPPEESPEIERAMEKITEAAIWGKEAARSYAQTYIAEINKMARGLAGLKERILGRTAEEQEELERRELAMEALRRKQELELRGPEEELALGTEGASRLQDIALRELAQQQKMQERLRTLRLADQYARREREQRMFEREWASPGGAAGPMIGGAVLGAALNTLLRQTRPDIALRGFGRAPLVGAGAGLGLHLLRQLAQPSGRSVSRLERERYLPMSMIGEVAA